MQINIFVRFVIIFLILRSVRTSFFDLQYTHLRETSVIPVRELIISSKIMTTFTDELTFYVMN